MDKKQIEIWTDRFINDEMAPEERTAFCKEMESDEELRELVTLKKLIIEGELIAAEQKARQAMEQSVSPRFNQSYKWIAVACIFIIIAGLGIFGHSYKYDTDYIYNTYSFIPVIERSRGGGGLQGEAADVNDEIIVSYEDNKFDKVVYVFRHTSPKVLGQLPQHTSIYIAISLMNTNQPQEAINILSHLTDPEYKEDIEWLLLCGYLQTGAREAIITTAGKIIEEKGSYSSKALQIRNLIKERRWF